VKYGHVQDILKHTQNGHMIKHTFLLLRYDLSIIVGFTNELKPRRRKELFCLQHFKWSHFIKPIIPLYHNYDTIILMSPSHQLVIRVSSSVYKEND